jgi:hypothetical protein
MSAISVLRAMPERPAFDGDTMGLDRLQRHPQPTGLRYDR